MNNDVLALKYRPKFFKEVTGQDLIIETLINSIKLNKLHNAYLFSGTRGMGKTTIARLFAKSLLCESGISEQPCGTCSSCNEIDNTSHLDLIEIDAASRTKVEDTRNLMDNVQYAPSSSRFKIYLIDEVHMLSTKSFNALLKTIEEPPAHVKFLLATTEPEKLPDTILSRCLHFKLISASETTIISHLENILNQENIKYDISALETIARNANGSIRDSLSITEQCISFCNGNIIEDKINLLLGNIGYDTINKVITAIADKDAESLVTFIESIDDNIKLDIILDQITSAFFKLTLLNINKNLLDKEHLNYDFLTSIHQKFTKEDLQLFYQIAISSKKDFRYAADKKDYLIMILLRMIIFSENDNNSIENDKITTEKTNNLKSNNDANDDVANIKNNWHKTVNELPLDGLALHLANHSVFDVNNNNYTLKINQQKKDIYPQTCIDDLVKIIQKHYSITSDIAIEYDNNLDTPTIIEKKLSESEASNRYDKVKDNPDINKIQKIFDANIDKDSIKKIID